MPIPLLQPKAGGAAVVPIAKRLLMAALVSLLLSGCQPDTTNDANGGLANSVNQAPAAVAAEIPTLGQEQAAAQFADIQRHVKAANKLTPEIVQRLLLLHQQAPTHRPTIELLTKVYLQREDWNGLADLLQEKPAELRSQKEQVQLATILAKAQRFQEAFTLSDSLQRIAEICSRYGGLNLGRNQRFATAKNPKTL